MGPLKLSTKFDNGLEWAHWSGLEQLPKILNAPDRDAHKAEYALEWVH